MRLKAISCLIVATVSFTLLGQQNEQQILIQENIGWYKTAPGVQISTSEFLENRLTSLGLGDGNQLRVKRQDIDQLGYIHTRTQQFYKGTLVEGAEIVLHERNGDLYAVNGDLVLGLELSTSPSLGEEEAITAALHKASAQEYAWGKDRESEFYPTPELVIAQESFNQEAADYRLFYKVPVFSLQPLSSRDYFVDAQTGKVNFSIDRMNHADAVGVAHTKYSGVRNFITDSVAPNHYELRSSTTKNQITTYDLKQTLNIPAATVFSDSDNVWNNYNAAQDEVATDVHWGSQATVDFFDRRFGADVNNGWPIRNYIHFGINLDIAAYAEGMFIYGDGDSVIAGPATTLDIVAHELTHSITRFSSNLNYSGESGALNESFSDIFGVAVRFAEDSANADYSFAGQTQLSGGIYRSLKDPKAANDPDTYLGQHWYTGGNYSELVHTNSGVQNHWFYLLAEGGVGSNDNNHNFALQGIGRKNAENIAYRNLVYYLTPTSDYGDARMGSIFAAEDLFGLCSFEVKETARAWKAVGVGDKISNLDAAVLEILWPVTSCGLTTDEDLQVLIRNFGCPDTLRKGDTINISYQQNGQRPSAINHILNSDLPPGDSLYLTASNAFDLSKDTSYAIRAWVTIQGDQDPTNDTLSALVTNRGAYQNSDFELVKVDPEKDFCNLDRSRTIVFTYKFLGCDSVRAGDTLYFGVHTYDEDRSYSRLQTDTVIIPRTLYYGDEITYYNRNKYISAKSQGYGEKKSWLHFPRDENQENDTLLTAPFYKPVLVGRRNSSSFRFPLENAQTSRDSMLLLSPGGKTGNLHASVEFVDAIGTNNSQALKFSGEKKWFELDTVRMADTLLTLPKGSGASSVCFCLNAFKPYWPGDSLFLEFDLKQTASHVWQDTYNSQAMNSSKFWVSMSLGRVGKIFYPQSFNQDQFVHHQIDLTKYVGSRGELCLNSINFISEGLDTISGSQGDNTILDNIWFHDENHHFATTEQVLDAQLKIYPNPGSGIYYLELHSDEEKASVIEVSDLRGKKIHTRSISLQSGGNQLEISLEDEPTGVYLMTIFSGNTYISRKLIKQ